MSLLTAVAGRAATLSVFPAGLPQERTELTPAEYGAVEAVFADFSRLPELPCHLSPEVSHRPAV